MNGHDHSPWEDERAAYLLDALEADERSVFESHLAGCASCQAELRWLAPAIDVLPAAVEQIEPPPALRDRILGAIEADTVTPPARRQAERPSAWNRFLAQPALAGAAAAVALAIGIAGGYALGGDSADPQPVATTVPIETAAPSVPAAGNLVNDGDRWTLDISDLPDLEPGRVYQVWMRKGEELIPSVLFVPSRDGTANIVLPDETGTTDEMLVTSEPTGGSEEPTSPPLVTAKL